MRPVWTGALSFGLVNIPVRLHSAVQTKGQMSFRLLHSTDHSPIRYERVCEKEDTAVEWDDIVKGFEYTKGKFVVLTDDDFKAAAIESSRAIEILDFVKAEEIDPRYFETPYYLVPDTGGDKAYALLRSAIADAGVVGIGRITMRTNTPHLAGVKAVGDALVLEIMRFASELTDTGDFPFPTRVTLRAEELRLARQLVDNLSGPFDPSKYVDDYRANLMKIVRAKLKGKTIEAPAAAERAGTPVIDLMARLQESLETAKGSRRAGTTRRRGAAAKQTRRHATRRTRRARKTA